MTAENQSQPTEGEVVSTSKPQGHPKPTAAERKLQERQRDIQLAKAERVSTETTNVLDPVAYSQMKQLAADLIAGGAATPDADTPEKLLVKLQAGYELGMKPVESNNSLYIVNGRVTIWGAALIRQMRKQGWSVQYTDETPGSCTIVATHDINIFNRQKVEDTFLYQDAVDSGYTQDKWGKEKVGWRQGQNRKLKMRYGAASQLAKTYIPEVLGSITGVAEIDMDAPEIVPGESVAVVDSDIAQRIENAADRAELAAIVQDAPLDQRPRLMELAKERAAKLEEAA